MVYIYLYVSYIYHISIHISIHITIYICIILYIISIYPHIKYIYLHIIVNYHHIHSSVAPSCIVRADTHTQYMTAQCLALSNRSLPTRREMGYVVPQSVYTSQGKGWYVYALKSQHPELWTLVSGTPLTSLHVLCKVPWMMVR